MSALPAEGASSLGHAACRAGTPPEADGGALDRTMSLTARRTTMDRSQNPAEGARRFPLRTATTMTARQRDVYRGIVSGPRKGAAGPFNALLRSPEVADRVQRVGEYVRFQTSIPAALNEMAILITGRFWSAQFEFWAHRRLAQQAGLPDRIIDAIAEGRRPSPMSDDERIVYDFCTELFHHRAVSDGTFKAVVDRFR